jgi:hypothetical protein
LLQVNWCFGNKGEQRKRETRISRAIDADLGEAPNRRGTSSEERRCDPAFSVMLIWLLILDQNDAN